MGTGEAFGEAEDEVDSSRRTARRWRAQTPTNQGLSAFQSSPATSSGDNLSVK